MAVRSGLPDGLVFWVCHGAVRSVYPTVYELPRCREVDFIQRLYIISTAVTSGLPLRCREVGFIQRLYIISTAVRSGLPDGLGWVHGMVHCWFLCK